MKTRQYEALIRAACEQHGLPPPKFEIRLCPERRWRLDFGWPDRKIGVEIQGGIWPHYRKIRGRLVLCVLSGHNTGKGLRRWIEKHNAATLAGWRILYTVPEEAASPALLEQISRLMVSSAS